MYFVALNRLKIIRNLEGRFEEAIIAYLFLVNLVPVIIIPMMWYEAKKVAQLLNHWNDFEVCVVNISESVLVLVCGGRQLHSICYKSAFSEKFNLTKWPLHFNVKSHMTNSAMERICPTLQTNVPHSYIPMYVPSEVHTILPCHVIAMPGRAVVLH